MKALSKRNNINSQSLDRIRALTSPTFHDPALKKKAPKKKNTAKKEERSITKKERKMTRKEAEAKKEAKFFAVKEARAATKGTTLEDSEKRRRPGLKLQKRMNYWRKQLSKVQLLSLMPQYTAFTLSVASNLPPINDPSSLKQPQHSHLRIVTSTKNPTKVLLMNVPNSLPVIAALPLIVLDINGILCHRMRRSRYEAMGLTRDDFREHQFHAVNTNVIERPGLVPFVESLDRHFCLAVWTSAKNKTAHKLISKLLPPEIANCLLFVWAQHHCDVQDGVFTKDLAKVWADYPLWNACNTLLIDDSPDKCVQAQNAIHPPAVDGLQWEQSYDMTNAKRLDDFVCQLVDHWKEHALVQDFDLETEEGFFLNERAQLEFLRQNAVDLGWEATDPAKSTG